MPRYLHLDLGRQTQHNVARFRLHYHMLHVEKRSWEHHDGISVDCRQFKTKTMLFSCVLACKRDFLGFNLHTCVMIYHSLTPPFLFW